MCVCVCVCVCVYICPAGTADANNLFAKHLMDIQHINVYIYIYTFIHIHTYIYMQTCIFKCIYLYTYMYVHTHTCMQICVYVLYMYSHIYEYIHEYGYTYIHIACLDTNDIRPVYFCKEPTQNNLFYIFWRIKSVGSVRVMGINAI